MNKFNKNKYEFTYIAPLVSKDNFDRKSVIELFFYDLDVYGVLFRDLINVPLTDKERNIALNIAMYIVENNSISQEFIYNKNFNIVRVSRITNIKLEFIRRAKHYIVAYWIILNSSEYSFIKAYLGIRRSNGANGKIIQTGTYSGIVFKNGVKNSSCILTSSGLFKKIKTIDKKDIGDICEGKSKVDKRVYKIPICIVILFSIIILSSTYFNYKRASSVVVVQLSSNVRISSNIYRRVIHSSSETQKGKKLLDEVKIQNEVLDESICKVIEYAYNNDMIKEGGKVVLAVSGEPLEYGELKQTSDFINNTNSESHNISVVINNCGNEQKLLTN